MKFGLMYEIQIPEPHYPGIEKERYDQVLAQVDDLGKLVDELAGMLDGAGLVLPRGVDSRGIVPPDVDQVLAVLRESTERLSVGGGGGQAVLRR